jgi:hypothetical protein
VSLQTQAGAIAAALAPLQSQIAGLQVTAAWVENPTPPHIDIYPPPGLFMTGAGFGPRSKQVFWTIRLRVNMADPAAAQTLLLRMLDPTDPASVVVALDHVAYESLEVTGYHQYADDNGEQRMLGCEWTVSQFL